MATTEKRRICWPDPDATCLQGGCIHCDGCRPRSLAVIERWARKVGTVHHRCDPTPVDALKAFEYGRVHGAGQ